MKKVLWFLICVSSTITWGQLNAYTFEEIEALEEKRPIVVFLHTEWCKPCKVMKRKTLRDEKVIEVLNKKYYFVSFDAEQKEDVVFNGNTFSYKADKKKSGIHELAETLGTYEFRTVYPTTVVLNKKKEIIFQYPSTLRPKGFIRMLSAIEANEKM